MTTRIIVIGGGLAGIATAIGCRLQGREVVLCEQAAAFQPVGAGLTIAPSVRAALAYLGCGDAFEVLAEPPERPVLLDWSTGQPLAQPGQSDHLNRVRRISRADLHTILLQRLQAIGGCELRFGAELISIEQDAKRVTALLRGGERIDGTILLGADGIRSTACAAIHGEGRPEFTGYIATRFMLAHKAASPFLHKRGVTVTAGRAASLTCYTVAQGSLVNCVAITRSAEWTMEGWSVPGDADALTAQFATANADARALVALAGRSALFSWGLFDRPVAHRWTDRRIALLGDAAHPVLPFLGLGAGLAIEDAVVLARCLAELPANRALAHYERARIPRATLIHAASRAQGRAFARLGDRGTAEPAPFFDTALFDYDPVTTPLL